MPITVGAARRAVVRVRWELGDIFHGLRLFLRLNLVVNFRACYYNCDGEVKKMRLPSSRKGPLCGLCLVPGVRQGGWKIIMSKAEGRGDVMSDVPPDAEPSVVPSACGAASGIQESEYCSSVCLWLEVWRLSKLAIRSVV